VINITPLLFLYFVNKRFNYFLFVDIPK